MLPVDEDDEKLVFIDDTIYISAAGTVVSSSKETATFYMCTQQYVCGQQEDVAVRAIMNKNPKWKNPLEMLPHPNSMIAFDGVLDKFETYKPDKRSKGVTCAVVSVQDVTFLQNVEDGGAKTDNTAMRDKLKNRKLKKVDVNPCSLLTTPDASQGSSLPSTSQKALGKRKASCSEEEIEQVTSL